MKSREGEKIVLSDLSNGHTLVLGSSGQGKRTIAAGG